MANKTSPMPRCRHACAIIINIAMHTYRQGETRKIQVIYLRMKKGSAKKTRESEHIKYVQGFARGSYRRNAVWKSLAEFKANARAKDEKSFSSHRRFKVRKVKQASR